jgi:SAM-dependent methyltransferase
MPIKKIKDVLYVTKEWVKKVFIYPQQKIAHDGHFDYDQYWKVKRGTHMQALGRWQKKRAEKVIESLKNEQNITINDIGSGSGEVLVYIRDHLSVSSAIAYDSSDYALERAKEVGLKTVKMNINVESDHQKIGPADYSLMFEILEHVHGSEKLLKHAYDVSKKGVFFSFPNTGFCIHRFRLLFGKFPLQWANHPGEHLRFWTNADLKWWLKALGYKDYKIHYYIGVPFLKNIWPGMFAAGFLVFIPKDR